MARTIHDAKQWEDLIRQFKEIASLYQGEYSHKVLPEDGKESINVRLFFKAVKKENQKCYEQSNQK